MTNEEFKYWINGYLALTSEEILAGTQLAIIINHANLVKAIAGDLDSVNGQFISILKTRIKQHNNVPLFDLREIHDKLYYPSR